MNWRAVWSDHPTQLTDQMPAVCRRSASAVSHSTWFTAEPGPARTILPDLGPDSQPEENQNHDLPEKNTTHIYIRH